MFRLITGKRVGFISTSSGLETLDTDITECTFFFFLPDIYTNSQNSTPLMEPKTPTRVTLASPGILSFVLRPLNFFLSTFVRVYHFSSSPSLSSTNLLRYDVRNFHHLGSLTLSIPLLKRGGRRSSLSWDNCGINIGWF